MKKVLFVCLLLWACSKNHNRISKHYYDSGNLKEIEYYSNNKTDSIYYFYDESSTPLQQITIFGEKTGIHLKVFYKNGNLFKKGNKSQNENKTGKWQYYNSKGELSDVREYKLINGKTILNQIWYLDKKGDTISIGSKSFNTYDQKEFEKEEIPKKSHFMSITSTKDTIRLNEPYKAILIYHTPKFKFRNSKIEVYTDDEFEGLKKDFSNEKEVPLWEFKSLAYDTINQKWYPDKVGIYNYISAFGATFKTTGQKMLRGYMAEIVTDTMEDGEIKEFTVNKIYFELPIFVKDTVH